MSTQLETQTRPTKSKVKVSHVTIGSRVDAAIATGATEVLALCGRFTIQMKNLAPRQPGKPTEARRCKTCVKALEANWRRYDDSVIRDLEKQFSGGSHD